MEGLYTRTTLLCDEHQATCQVSVTVTFRKTLPFTKEATWG